MTIWQKIAEIIERLSQGESLFDVLGLRKPPEKTIAFTIAIIALGAKMARADGHVSSIEIEAFKRIFTIPNEEENNFRRIFNLAKQDVAGYEAYAKQITGMFGKGNKTLEDILEGLFEIAVADNEFHPAENDFLSHVASIFGVPEELFLRIRARWISDASADPFALLGISPAATRAEIDKAYKNLIKLNHPDALIARGAPSEAIGIAINRVAAINTAYETLTKTGLDGLNRFTRR